MKKFFTLLAFLTCFLGANAVEIVDAEVDFSQFSDISKWNFPYGWGGSESARARLSIVDGCLHFQSEEATDPSWDCQFFPIGGVTAEVDVTYTLHFKIKGDHDGNVSMLGFGQTPYGQFSITSDWVEGTVDYVCTNASEGQILMQCGDWIGSWDIAYLKITHEGREQRPVTWQQWITDDGKSIIPGVETESKYVGDAEFGAWPEWALEKDGDINANWRTDRAPEICAWSLTMGKNFDDQAGDISQDSPRARPYPTDIEEEAGNPSNHVFAVHVDQIDVIDDDASIAWSNQFWIQSPASWKAGTQVRVKFRYKAEHACSTQTQIHTKNPSIYLWYVGVGDVNFTTEWQEFEKTITFDGSQGGGWSVAFNLCSDATNGRTPNVFYFDDLSWETMVLDEGHFVAASNSKTGLEYDFDNAIEFQAEDDLMVATVGTVGKKDTWVNEIMISTVRGNDGAFKGGTIKPSGTYTGEDNWGDYTDGSNAKIKLPAAGVWKISLDVEGKQINIVKLEGEEEVGPIEINPNPTVIVVNGLERDDLKDTETEVREGEGGEGQTWDNQFFIRSNRALSAGEVTVIEFDFVATKEARSTTQCQGEPGQYMHWDAIGDVNFTTEEQHFSKTFTVPAEGDGMLSLSFDMAVIKEACDYTIKNVVWKLEDNTESLINQTGGENFYIKVGAGTDPYQFEPSAINGVVVKDNASDAIYNLSGQRVTKAYKGVVVKAGKKYLVK